MRMLRFVSTLLLATLAFAQQQKPGSVSGQVVSVNGDPLRKAQVTLRSTTPNRGNSQAMATTTNASGGFAFENITPGSYILTAQRNGYVGQVGRSPNRRSGAPPAFQGISVAAGQAVSGVTIKLTPHSVVTGKVVDEDGEPMYGAQIQIMEEKYFRGRRTLTPRSQGSVNDLGEYRIAGLQPGRYFVSVDPRGDMGPGAVRVRTQGEEVERSFVTMYYPGVTDQRQATALELEPGQEARGVDIQLRKTATVHIRGQVVDEAGAPAANTSVMALNGEAPASAMGRSMGPVRPDGTFEISGVQPGSYMLMANRMTRDRGRAVAFQNVQVGSRDLDNVVLRMTTPAQVTGVVRSEEPIDVKNVRVTLDPMETMPYEMHSSRNIGEGNTFTVPNVTPGSYRVDVFGAPEGYYLKSVQAAGQEFLTSGIAINTSVSGLEVMLAKGAVTVEGSVADGASKPLGQSVIALVPPAEKRTQWSLFKTSMADQGGNFAFRNLAPGEYTLIAFSPGEDATSVQNPEFLKQVEAKGTVVKLGGNARESVQLKAVE